MFVQIAILITLAVMVFNDSQTVVGIKLHPYNRFMFRFFHLTSERSCSLSHIDSGASRWITFANKQIVNTNVPRLFNWVLGPFWSFLNCTAEGTPLKKSKILISTLFGKQVRFQPADVPKGFTATGKLALLTLNTDFCISFCPALYCSNSNLASSRQFILIFNCSCYDTFLEEAISRFMS